MKPSKGYKGNAPGSATRFLTRFPVDASSVRPRADGENGICVIDTSLDSCRYPKVIPSKNDVTNVNSRTPSSPFDHCSDGSRQETLSFPVAMNHPLVHFKRVHMRNGLLSSLNTRLISGLFFNVRVELSEPMQEKCLGHSTRERVTRQHPNRGERLLTEG